MKREGPSLLTWLWGRVSYPRPSGACAACGRPGADGKVQEQLEREGFARASRASALCDRCRREALEQQLRTR